MAAQTEQPPALQLDGVFFSYRRRKVFQGLNLVISAPVTARMGPNGAGKTTLLGLASGTLRAAQGAVHAGGSVGMLPQRFTFPPFVRVEQAVAHAAWSAGAPAAELPGLARAALERVHLDDRAGDRVSALSGGQRQRLGIACVLGVAPRVLLLDEPSVGLDPVERQSLRRVLREVSSETAVVLSTHLADDVATLADDVVVIDKGEVRFTGPMKSFVDEPERDPTRALEAAYVAAVGADSA